MGCTPGPHVPLHKGQGTAWAERSLPGKWLLTGLPRRLSRLLLCSSSLGGWAGSSSKKLRGAGVGGVGGRGAGCGVGVEGLCAREGRLQLQARASVPRGAPPWLRKAHGVGTFL